MTGTTPAPGTCRFLFAYGTLMSQAGGTMGRAQRERLARETSVLAQAATFRGRLFDLGRYPGLVDDGTPGVVHGEVREMLDPAKTLAWLDCYEGIVSGEHDHNEYERAQRQVMLGTGSPIMAWVYLYRKPTTGLVEIAEGRWSPTPGRKSD